MTARIAPIWSAALPAPAPPFPGGMVHADTAVVGGGLAGLSAALHLLRRRPGARVVVLEAGRIGAGASGRSTGMLGPGVGQSLVALVRRFGATRAQALYRATLRAVDDTARLARDEQIDCELTLAGQLLVATTAGGRRRVAAEAALLEAFSLPVERLDDDALSRRLRLARRAPPSGGAAASAALRLPVAGTLHPGRLLAGLAAAVSARGGVIFEGARVAALDPAPGGATHLAVAGGGAVHAAEVVVATAGYTPHLGLLRGRVLPVHLQALVTEPLDAAACAAIGWAGREGVVEARRIFDYFRLTADDRIVFGGGAPRYRWSGRTEDGAAAGDAALARLAAELGRTFPTEARLRVAGGWTGVIGYVVDALPAIERVRARPSVLQVLGWCGHGVALSVASGAWVAQLLCDGAAPEDLPWYRDTPPLVPLEPVRWLGFKATVGAMALLDRLG